MAVTRRDFLRSGALAVAAASSPLQPLLTRRAWAGPGTTAPIASPYGAVAPVADASTGLELLSLPPGFRYASFSWTGDTMTDGTPVPSSHDGMAVVKQLAGREEELILVRNHERSSSTPFGPGGTPTFDAGAGGGTTTLRFRKGAWVSDEASLTGTFRNCAGGPTPWGSWLTCEESLASGHGYVFEVPADSSASAVAITDLGRMNHEAAAVDPRSGYVYETEDRGDCGFYRMIPNDLSGQVGSLESGGTLQMCKVLDGVGAPIDDWSDPLQGEVRDVTWVDVDPTDPYDDGKSKGATTFRRGEGCWWSDAEEVIYWVSTSGGAAGRGVVFCYHPPTADPTLDGELEAFFVSDASAEANAIDNLTVSAHGGLLLTEDGSSNPERLMGLTADACSYVFCENNVDLSSGDIAAAGKNVSPGNYRSSEMAGVCFDPDGRYLFVNVQVPGISFAITGPWNLGPL